MKLEKREIQVERGLKMGMGTWKTRIIHKQGKASRTPGNKKNPETCQSDFMKKYFAKRSRSYKTLGYSDWCRKMSALNGNTY